MGMPFPLGIDYLKSKSDNLLPLAFGTDGSMSVVGTLAGGLLLIYFGMNAAFIFGLASYFMATAVFCYYYIIFAL
ncbi:MAG: hypothetical protein HYV97_08055 [Bdellovibrio sp.]|nr:hypothetical protein [Bdellovibrio sp.]